MESRNFKKIKIILYVILFANLGVAIAKIVLGYLIGSGSISADGIHSLSDGASNIIGVIAISFAAKPVDEDHPYGHKKYETIASMFIASMLLFLAYNIFTTAIGKIVNPTPINVTLESILVLIVTLIINIGVASYENIQGKKLKSDFLIADSMHTRSDIFISIGVLVALVLIKLGVPPIIDTLVSFVVGGFILHAAYEIFRDNISVLTDKVILTEDEVRAVLKEFGVIKNVHNIRSRGYYDHIFLDMHIRVDADLSIDAAHRLVHKVEDTFKEKLDRNVDVVIHVEPYLGNDDSKEFL